MDVLAVALAVAVVVGLIFLRIKLNRAAVDAGRRNTLPPGPARLTLGLGMSVLFVTVGVLALVLPEQPWSTENTSRGIPWGVYGLVLVPCGLAFAVTVIRNRNKVIDRSPE